MFQEKINENLNLCIDSAREGVLQLILLHPKSATKITQILQAKGYAVGCTNIQVGTTVPYEPKVIGYTVIFSLHRFSSLDKKEIIELVGDVMIFGGSLIHNGTITWIASSVPYSTEE